MKTRIVFILIAAVALLGVSAAFAAEDGAAIFKAKCASCHGPDGAGQTAVGKSMKLRDLRSEEVQKMKGEEMEKIIADGKGKMPAYKSKLKEAEIDELVKYVKSLKK
jgi:cytochrome c6